MAVIERLSYGGDAMIDRSVDATDAIGRRRQWAARVSWYVYATFVVVTYAGLLAIPIQRALIVTRGPLVNRLHQAGEMIADLLFLNPADFLPILFMAATFPFIAGYAVRGLFLLIVVRDASCCRSAAMMLALLSPVSMAVKLVLAGMGGSLSSVIVSDFEYFGMCSLPLVMAALLAFLARLVPAGEKPPR